MIEKIRKLKIKGGKFEKETTFEFFKNENQRVAIVYGRNGSGKSTIAKGFRGFVKVNFEEDSNEDCIGEQIKIDLFDESNNNINNDIKDKVVVFDEKYIDENVGFKSDGLNTIVLIGNQNIIENEIKINENKLGEYKRVLKIKQDILKKYEDDNNIFKSACKNLLKNGEGSWRKRKKEITSNDADNTVDVDGILRFEVVESKKLINKKYEVLWQKFIKSKSLRIPTEEIKPLEFDYKYDDIKNIFSKVINKHVASDDELSKLIYNNIQMVSVTEEILNKEEHCPYCYQKITKEYKEKLLNIIHDILNNEVDDYKNELNKYKLEHFQICNIDDYKTVCNDKIIVDISNNITELNEYIDSFNEILEKRKKNPFIAPEILINTLEIEFGKLENKQKEINNLIRGINFEVSRIKSYKTQDKNRIINDLSLLNNKKAFFEIFDDDSCSSVFNDFKKYNNNKCNVEKINKSIQKVNRQIEECEKNVSQLKEKQKNTTVACETINKYLSYILFSKSRIRIELENGCYVLKINDRLVAPENVSTGERNIIALCYFFIDSMEGDNQVDLYKTERLYVIDDPVSSFDYGNKIGIMSFLRWQYDLIINQSNSRMVIFSHDIFMVHDTIKCFIDIYKSRNYYDINKKVVFCRIDNDQLVPYDKENNNFYNELLIDVYNYASDENQYVGENNSIGNKMRRLVESFSIFSYKVGIEELSQKDEILELLPKDKRDYYKNSMYRLVLNGESHAMNSVQELTETDNFWNCIDENEKKKTAMQILSLMYLLNPKHIELQLDDKAKLEKIKTWVEEYK